MDNDLISRSESEKLGATCLARRNENGQLEAIISLDNAPTVDIKDQIAGAYNEGYMCGNKEAEKARPQGAWILVSEGLPNRNGCYNVTRKLNEGETIYFISDVSYFDGQNTWHRDVGVNHGRPYLTDIIAWQPLPEPYKEGGNKND